MCRSKDFDHHFILLPIVLLFCYSNDVHAGASSTQKNLVNLNTPNDNSNSTTSNQFQNEYQYRQTASKAPQLDRYKSATSSAPDLVYDHLVNDLSSLGTTDSYQDYSYQDNRAMTNVPNCKGRLRVNGTRGYITDGSGYYETNLQCTWLIDSGRSNSIIRIQLHQFNTECNYDFLYIFDGDSIYAPLVTALSGDMKDFSTYYMEPKIESMISNQDNPANFNATLKDTTNSAIIPNSGIDSRPIEFSTKSGKAFVYFHSDTAQSMPGFYMTYSIDSCPLDCSNRGECDHSSLTCRCNSGFFGDACQYTLCPQNCTSSESNTCALEKFCLCRDGSLGPNCNLSSDQGNWKRINSNSTAKAFHKSAVVDDVMWVFGGKSRELSNSNTGIYKHKKTHIVLAFDLNLKTWTDFVLYGITGEDHLADVSGHSVATIGRKIFIYGGIAMNNTVLDSLTVFDTRDRTVASLNVKKKSKSIEDEFAPPIASVGHSANIIDGQMFIFLGYNPVYGYLNLVQKFNIANNSWSIVRRKGSSVVGCIGHTSTYDSASGLVYIYGGHSMLRSKNLYSFDPRTETWTFLISGPSPRYYHSAEIVESNLVIFGGNSYNISHQSDQCFQQSYLLYDLSCSNSTDASELKNETAGDSVCTKKCWQAVEDPTRGLLKRYGHSIVRFKNELILYGGFNNIPLDDVRALALTNCSSVNSEAECNKPRLLSNCSWNSQENICQHDTKSLAHDRICTKNSVKALCESRETCTDCLSTSFGCVWCDYTSQCQYKKCKSLLSKSVFDPELCHRPHDAMGFSNSSIQTLKFGSSSHSEDEMDCKVENCYLCYSKPYCSWQHEQQQCLYNAPNVMANHFLPTTQDDTISELNSNSSNLVKTTNSFNQTRILQKLDPFKSLITTLSNGLVGSSSYQSCDAPCYLRRSCNECTTTRCIWCSTSEQCIDSSAYFAYHTMGQCMHYVAHILKCPVASCADIETCDKCLTNPKCGWLNDISNTGKGRCMDGDTRGPSFALSEGNTTSMSNILPNWHYTSCPSCQCNGHSFCKNENSVCMQPCQDNSDGPHCDRCIPGYFGDPVNGGSCRPCRCNGHAQSCNRETGKCYCSTKGIIGHNCNRCDDKNYYTGDPTSPNGTCYYNLTTDYQYTFNMSKPEDHFYSDINFINVPLRKDSDVDFTIACSRLALVNITSGYSYKSRKLIHANLECGTFRLRFPHDRHALTDANYSFFVHVYKFQTPFILQIAFSQHRTLYLPQFFFTFSSSFLFFFALSGLFYKLKHEYDLYMRRQRQFIEMEQMASRPFSTILLELFRPSTSGVASQRLAEPTPISFEPCFGNNVGVFSLFVQLPGRPNLAIGSALVSLSDDSALYEDEQQSKRTEKSNTSVKNL